MIIEEYLKIIFLIILCQIGSTKLVYVSTILRHGARYPVSSIYDGYEASSKFGQLTTVGMRQHYLLGGYLREEYIINNKFLNESFDSKQLQVFADYAQRCIQSTICHLLGLYPFGTGKKIPEGISQNLLDPPFESFLRNSSLRNKDGQFALQFGYQPVPYKNSAKFFPRCENYSERMGQILHLLRQLQSEMASFREKMKNLFSLSSDNTVGMANLYDVLVCDKYLGRQFPQKFTDQDYENLKFFYDYFYSLYYGGQVSKTAVATVMIETLRNMENKMTGKDKLKKFSIYSVHDHNIIPTVLFFQLTSHECLYKRWKNEEVSGNCAEVPPFASSFILQLHENDEKPGDYFVKIRYNGEYYAVWNCAMECPYEEFASKLKTNLGDAEKVCRR